MKTSEKLYANWKAGLWTEIKNGQGKYRLITMKTGDGAFHSTYPQAKNDFWANFCATNVLTPEYIDSRDWQIIRTIHPSELMGPGYEVGQKVRIKPNAKEKCLKEQMGWNEDRIKMFNDGFAFACNSDWTCWRLKCKDQERFTTFPATALEPYFEDEIETIEIGGKKYSKAEFEKAVKDLKPLE